MSSDPPLDRAAAGHPSAEARAATQTLASLRAEIDVARAELARLQAELAEAGRLMSGTLAHQLAEANEQLLHSALRARDAADSALGELDELAEIATRDPLTGLPTRATFLDRLATALASARRHMQCLAVLFIDIDGFKQVNDTQGHAAGDAVLCMVAATLAASVRESDTVSRFGGDEFVVLLPKVSSRADVILVAAKMKSALAAHEPGDVSVSIGIALYPHDGQDPLKLIRCADSAMYRSKRRARGGFAFHESAECGAGANAIPVPSPAGPATAHDGTSDT